MKLLDMVNHSLPVAGLVLCVGKLVQFAVHLLQFRGEFLTTELEFTESDYLGLVRIEETLALPLKTLATLLQLGLLRAERGQIVLLALRPALVQCRNDSWRTEQLTERSPYDRI